MKDESRASSTSAPDFFWSRLLSRPVQFILDLTVLVASFVTAYLLRFEFVLSEGQVNSLLTQLPLVVGVQISALMIFGVYSFIWRYVGMAELWAFLKAGFWSGLVLLIGRLVLPPPLQAWRVPLSIIFMDTVFAIAGVMSIRILRRALYEKVETGYHPEPRVRKPVILVGAGRAGVMAAREIRGRGRMDIWIEGFVDDDPRKQGAVLQGKRVLGTSNDLPRLCREFNIDHVIIAIAKVSRMEIRRIVGICEEIGVRVQIIPGLYEIIDGVVEITRFRDVQVEDLLGREQVRLEEGSIAEFLEDKVVLVTGAGGSIGSELARQVARFTPAKLLLLDRAEFALFEIDRELRKLRPEMSIVPLVADVCDESRIRAVFARYRPAVVFHAAAHKHVPLVESNPSEGVKNNVLGTWCVGEISSEFGAEAFILISTDKAVRPTSVMGASKRVAELAVQELNSRDGTRFLAVRFGNVLGSAGSVIPIFREQILEGGPVTVTDPEMVRYFMTIPEATQLVLQAGAMGNGGEIFILDMGEPVNIRDLAEDMIVLGGLKPHEDIEIVFTGLRPGEKLYEEINLDGEALTNTRHPKIYIGRLSACPSEEFQSAMGKLRELALSGRDQDLRKFLGEFIPESNLSV